MALARAWGVALEYPNDRINAALSIVAIGEKFRPALGFVNRAGIRQFDARGDYRNRFASGSRLRSWVTGFDVTQVDRENGQLESRRLSLTPFTFDTQPGDQISLDLSKTTEVLSAPFTLPGGLAVQPGR